MFDIAVSVADPVHPFGRRIRLGRVLGGLGADSIEFVKIEGIVLLGVGIVGLGCDGFGCDRFGLGAAALLFLNRFFEPGPAHFPGDQAFAVGVVLVFVKQLDVFVRVRVALAQEFLVVKFVPFLVFGRLVPCGLEGRGEPVHETAETVGRLALPLLLLFRAERPGWR